MKNIIVAVLLTTAFQVHASALESQDVVTTNFTKLDCVVPLKDAAPVVHVDVALANDTSVDFVTVTITGRKSNDVLFVQVEKGSVDAQLDQNGLSLMLIQEGVSVEDGVIKKAGVLSLQKDADGKFNGAMLALGNIYQLSCTRK